MKKVSSTIWFRVGIEPEDRLRWLLQFGHLDSKQVGSQQRGAIRQEARAFAALQKIDPALRSRIAYFPPPTDAAQNGLTDAQIWKAQKWLKEGLDRLRQKEIWRFVPKICYEVDAPKGILWVRLEANSALEEFKALAYDALREARIKFRLCPVCRKPFVPVRRQRYCSVSCSQKVRTRKWRHRHPEKNRELRRRYYREKVTAQRKLSNLRPN
jgi:hypothetical protein